MNDVATDGAAFDEAVVFLGHFKDLLDPRQQGKVSYPLDLGSRCIGTHEPQIGANH